MKTLKRYLVVGFLAGLFMLFAGTNKITCIPAPPEEPVCAEPIDCEGLPHILCVGEWTCQQGLCAWECKPEDPVEPPESECFADDECPPGHVCILESWCPPCVNEEPACLAPCMAYGECVAQPGCCVADADCPDGTVCITGGCEMAPQPGQCWTVDDCHPGQECLGVITCPCGALCFAAPQPGTCKSVDPEPIECLEDADCPDNYYCQVDSNCGGWDPGQPPQPVPCYMWGECLPAP